MTMQCEPFDTDEVAQSGASAGKRFALGLVAVTLFALGVRLYHLDLESLWYDELTQVMTYHLPVTYVVRAAAGHGQPPLDYLIGMALHRCAPLPVTRYYQNWSAGHGETETHRPDSDSEKDHG